MLDYRPLARRGLGPGIQRSPFPLYDVLGETAPSVLEDTDNLNDTEDSETPEPSSPQTPEIVAEVIQAEVAEPEMPQADIAQAEPTALSSDVFDPPPAAFPPAAFEDPQIEPVYADLAPPEALRETNRFTPPEPMPAFEPWPFAERTLSPERALIDEEIVSAPFEIHSSLNPEPEELPAAARNGGHACPVCGRKNNRPRFSSVGKRLMSRCLRCDLLTIVNPLGEHNPEAHADRLRCSMRSFWFNVREYLGGAGYRGPIGYSGPPEFLGPLTMAVGNRANIVPLNDLESYTRPGQCPAVLLFHALESEPDPEGLLTRCHRLLAPDGRLFVAASDAKSLQCMLSASRWSGLQLRGQLFCYSAGTLERLFRGAGFRVERSVHSGLEVLGRHFEIAIGSPPDDGTGFTGFLRKIAWQARALRSFRSVLFLEAAPTANPRPNAGNGNTVRHNAVGANTANQKRKRSRVTFQSGALADHGPGSGQGPDSRLELMRD